jgi:hypothetical protein
VRHLVVTVALIAFAASPAEGRLRTVSKLHATVLGETVRLHWKDRSTGETRYEVRRTGLKARLKRNRTSYTDRKIKRGTAYSYRVRACRHTRCAKSKSIRVRVLGIRPVNPRPEPPPPVPNDAFAGSPRIGGCPIFPKDSPAFASSTARPTPRSSAGRWRRRHSAGGC